MRKKLISWIYISYIGLTSLIFYLVALLIWLSTAWWDKRLVILHLFSCFWASSYILVMPIWSIRIEGLQKLDWKKTYVIVSNHQSQLDILAAYRLFFPFKWVSKAEVFRVPFLGWSMVLNKHIRLKRGDRRSTVEMFRECEKALKQGCSVFFFPEGTRSETGILRPFKPGAFALAKRLNVPVLPIAINGTRIALPKNSLEVTGRARLRVKVLDEIPPETLRKHTVEELCKMVQDKIAAHIDEHRPVEQARTA